MMEDDNTELERLKQENKILREANEGWKKAYLPKAPPNEMLREDDVTTKSYTPRPPSKFMEREWIIAFSVMALAGLLIYKGEMDKGIELVKWTMITFIGSRTAIKGMEVFKK